MVYIYTFGVICNHIYSICRNSFQNRNKFTTHNKWVTLLGFYGLMGLYPKLMSLIAGRILAIINYLYKKSPRDVYLDL